MRGETNRLAAAPKSTRRARVAVIVAIIAAIAAAALAVASSGAAAVVGVATEPAVPPPPAGDAPHNPPRVASPTAAAAAPLAPADPVAPSAVPAVVRLPEQTRPAPAPGRYLTFNALQPWYGLTNQLMCYAAALRYGIDDGRAVLFPAQRTAAAVLSFYDLVDVAATQRRLAGSGASIVYPSEADREFGYFTAPPSFVEPPAASPHPTVPRALYPPVSMNKRKLFLPERTEYRQRDVARARRSREYLVGKVYARSKKDRFVRHHNFFMRFAWPIAAAAAAGANAPTDDDATAAWDECRLMASIEPQRDMVGYADRLERAIAEMVMRGSGADDAGGASTQGFVAIHLRLESDASLLRGHGAKPTSAAQFRDFLKNTAAPFAKAAGVSVVYLCTGSLPPALAAVIDGDNAHFAGVRVTYRAALIKAIQKGDGIGGDLPPIRSFRGSQREAHAAKGHGARTQDHYMSFVELLLLQRARRTAVTHFSSLKFSVFARRCATRSRGASASSDAPPPERAVHTLSIGDDGSISKAFERFDCAGASGLGWCGHRAWGEG